jgi:mono/diheme cytochrome c family protein
MRARVVLIACSALALSGCERGLHEMYEQPKYKPLTPTTLFADGNSSRPQVPGTVPYSSGALAGASSGREDPAGRVALSEPVTSGYSNPLPITPALLARGRERFNIYCAPCHSVVGDGDGMIARRGFPAPPSYHSDRLRLAPDSHFYEVITHGYGVMYPYADRIIPADRWAIIAYIRALQLSQHAPAALLSAQDLARLRERTP